MHRATVFCSAISMAFAIGGIPGIPGIPGFPPTPPTPPTPPAATSAPVPISRNGAAVPAFDTIAAGSDNVAAAAGSYGPLPQFLKDATAYLPTATWNVDQGFKFDCPASTGGETFPCVYYIVFQHCGSCTEPTNGGLTELSLRPGFSFGNCSPRFAPAGTSGESYPTGFFKAVVPRDEVVEIFMEKPATAFAVFDGTATQCTNLLSNACNARSDCIEPPMGGCVDAGIVCPLRSGPFQSGGSCPSCWAGGL
eukprot:TRINITY_DN121_c2_g1_i2.p1 TRINITY_DN121_c2_g1~~TRINITY_DN121_c2_g1_i2.p1  ORF type:complete len:251 (+),score=58.42 TRINITY_DN121_c2_g1_i2:56-808(+)